MLKVGGLLELEEELMGLFGGCLGTLTACSGKQVVSVSIKLIRGTYSTKSSVSLPV